MICVFLCVVCYCSTTVKEKNLFAVQLNNDDDDDDDNDNNKKEGGCEIRSMRN
jgi:hypothetical protein